MRLHSVNLYKFGSFEFQELSLSRLTVLFGPNGAGKSTILNAIEDALKLKDGRPGLNSLSKPRVGSSTVYAMLDDQSKPGSRDEQILREVIWSELRPRLGNIGGISFGESQIDDCPSLADLRKRLAIRMLDSGKTGTPETRFAFVKHLLEHSQLAFGGLNEIHGSDWGLVCTAAPDNLAVLADSFGVSSLNDGESARSIEVTAEDDDLFGAVWNLYYGQDAVLINQWESSQASDTDRNERVAPLRNRLSGGSLYKQICPMPMRLDFDPETVGLELEEAVDRIARRLSPQSPAVGRGKIPWLFRSPIVDSEPSEIVRMLKPIDTTGGESFVLSPLIRSAVSRIATRANLIAPSFLKEECRIEIDIKEPSRWEASSPRLQVALSQDGVKIPLSRVGSGMARWASYSIRLACQELFASETLVRDRDGNEVLQLNVTKYTTKYDDITFESVSQIELIPQDMDVVLLIDEPEAHLHPKAVASIGKWLLDIAPRVSAVVVATHHTTLFNLRNSNLSKYVVLKEEGESLCKLWDPNSEDLVTEMAHSVGLSPGDVFMMSRYVLFVEGPHDIAVLEELFGDAFIGSSVRLLPLHGVKNISLLATSDIVWQMGIPFGVLTDNTDAERVSRGERTSYEEKVAVRMLTEARMNDRQIDVFGLSLDDILFYLDDDVVAGFSNGSFSGWGDAKTQWKQIDQPRSDTMNGTKFKSWIESTFGIRLDRDSVRLIARECRSVGKIPTELSGVVAEVISRTM